MDAIDTATRDAKQLLTEIDGPPRMRPKAPRPASSVPEITVVSGTRRPCPHCQPGSRRHRH
ncbi:hypothetical protein ABZ671_18735 [Micromonospora sp. NPDC006766]|uniref:hypothetical protein n=1 Tax=Micromonospora sp. NPDC006766 TaxID=3154778 RepID=UPI0033DFA529